MPFAEIVIIALLMVLLVLVIATAVRRRMLSKSGGIAMCWRTALHDDGTGWIFGQAKYDDQRLILFRSFSPLPFPSRLIGRKDLRLGDRRAAVGAEPDLLPVGSVIVRCRDSGTAIEMAMSEQVLTGLRSWLESVPPSTRGIRGERRSGLREI